MLLGFQFLCVCGGGVFFGGGLGGGGVACSFTWNKEVLSLT